MDSILLSDSKKNKNVINLDPRIKLLILVIGNITVMISPSINYEIILALSILVFGLFSGVYKYSLKMTLFYFLLIGMQTVASLYFGTTLRILIVTFASFIRKIFPCAMLGGILVSTTRVNEFMAAMNKIHMPRTIVIPLAVTLRYFPMIKEEWGHIRDAMKMRGISGTLINFIKNPILTLECMYVPMIISASKVADELSAAAMTRSIDNPKKRSSMKEIKIKFADIFFAVYFITLLVLVFYI